jgi:hypothetical protein
MNSSQSRCASSTRSSNGSFFAAARNFFTNMVSFYSVERRAQAVDLSFVNRQSPFSHA